MSNFVAQVTALQLQSIALRSSQWTLSSCLCFSSAMFDLQRFAGTQIRCWHLWITSCKVNHIWRLHRPSHNLDWEAGGVRQKLLKSTQVFSLQLRVGDEWCNDANDRLFASLWQAKKIYSRFCKQGIRLGSLACTYIATQLMYIPFWTTPARLCERDYDLGSSCSSFRNRQKHAFCGWNIKNAGMVTSKSFTLGGASLRLWRGSFSLWESMVSWTAIQATASLQHSQDLHDVCGAKLWQVSAQWSTTAEEKEKMLQYSCNSSWSSAMKTGCLFWLWHWLKLRLWASEGSFGSYLSRFLRVFALRCLDQKGESKLSWANQNSSRRSQAFSAPFEPLLAEAYLSLTLRL